MKYIIVAICCCFYVKNVQSQYDKWSISAFTGLAIPVGKFVSKSSKDNTSAFAKIGYTASLSFKYKLNKHFGLSTLLRFQENKVDTKTIEANNLNGIPRSVYNININSDNWKMGIIMAGGNYFFSVSKKFYLDFTLMAGFLKTTVPKLTELNSQFELVYSNGVTMHDTTYTLITKNKNPLKLSFCYLVAGSIKYRLNNRTFIVGVVDYCASNPNIKLQPLPVVTSITTPSGTIFVSNGTIIPTGQLNYKQSITTLNLSFGIELNF